MTEMQKYLLEFDEVSVENVAINFNTTWEEVTEVYYQMVCDGTVAEYDSKYKSNSGNRRLDKKEAENLRAYLRKYMSDKSLTREGLSEAINISKTTLQGWLRYGRSPCVKTANRVAEAFGVPLMEIVA